jgi:hypothetical protein
VPPKLRWTRDFDAHHTDRGRARELEGLITDTVHEDDAADWVDGRITLDELIQRGLDRYTVA